LPAERCRPLSYQPASSCGLIASNARLTHWLAMVISSSVGRVFDYIPAPVGSQNLARSAASKAPSGVQIRDYSKYVVDRPGWSPTNIFQLISMIQPVAPRIINVQRSTRKSIRRILHSVLSYELFCSAPISWITQDLYLVRRSQYLPINCSVF
jgi:hypothetical protein